MKPGELFECRVRGARPAGAVLTRLSLSPGPSDEAPTLRHPEGGGGRSLSLRERAGVRERCLPGCCRRSLSPGPSPGGVGEKSPWISG